MVQTKLFCFPYLERIQVNAIAYLYPDGSLKDIEIEHAHLNGVDILLLYQAWENPPLFVQRWKERFYSEAKRLGALHIQCLLANYSLYEYNN